MKLKPLLQNIALLAASLVVVALILELGFRIRAYSAGDDGTIAELAEDSEPGGRIRQMQPSTNDRIIYELKPRLQVVDSEGNLYTTNSLGFRSAELPPEKGPGTVRILGLGDSVMYGSGVSDDETFLALLSDLLNEHLPAHRCELVNTAVPGYNTVMEVETLETRGLALDPDLVVMMFVGNHLDLPNFIREPDDPLDKQSFLVRALGRRLGRLKGIELINAPRSEEGNWFAGDRDKVPAQYRDMVGPEAYRTAMHRLARLRDEHGFELLVLQQWDRNPAHHEIDELAPGETLVRSLCEDLAIPYFAFEPAIDRFMDEHRIRRWRGSILSVSESDPHPSAVGHQLYAEALFDFLAASGRLSRLADATIREPS